MTRRSSGEIFLSRMCASVAENGLFSGGASLASSWGQSVVRSAVNLTHAQTRQRRARVSSWVRTYVFLPLAFLVHKEEFEPLLPDHRLIVAASAMTFLKVDDGCALLGRDGVGFTDSLGLCLVPNVLKTVLGGDKLDKLPDRRIALRRGKEDEVSRHVGAI